MVIHCTMHCALCTNTNTKTKIQNTNTKNTIRRGKPLVTHCTKTNTIVNTTRQIQNYKKHKYNKEMHASGYPLHHSAPRAQFISCIHSCKCNQLLTRKLFYISNVVSSIELTLPCIEQMTGEGFLCKF